jgi:hypothetical protein
MLVLSIIRLRFLPIYLVLPSFTMVNLPYKYFFTNGKFAALGKIPIHRIKNQ